MPACRPAQEREDADSDNQPRNGGKDLPTYYESLEDSIKFANDVLPS